MVELAAQTRKTARQMMDFGVVDLPEDWDFEELKQACLMYIEKN
jgi:hypothetical protein